MTATLDFEIFARVARTGNMSAAGRELKLSPAVVSKRISMLEERIGARLFQRTTRQLTLTDIGEGFFKRVVDIINLVEEAHDFVNRSNVTPRGLMRIACSNTLYRNFIIKHLRGFNHDYPEIEFDVDITENNIDVIRGGYDVALKIGRETDSELVAHSISPVEYVLCASPRYLDLAGTLTTIKDLEFHNCLFTNDADTWDVYRGTEKNTIHVRGNFRSNSSEFTRRALVEGLGIAFLPRIDVEDEIDTRVVQQVLPDYHGAQDLGVLAIHPSRDFMPSKLSVFIDYMIKHAASPADVASPVTV